MIATFTIDGTGQINPPDSVKRLFGLEPGVRLRAELTSDRIEIVNDILFVTKTIREERDEFANQALTK